MTKNKTKIKFTKNIHRLICNNKRFIFYQIQIKIINIKLLFKII